MGNIYLIRHGQASFGSDDYDVLSPLFALMVQRWHDGEHESDGLETWQAFTTRVKAGLDRVLDGAGSGDNIAIFTSGGTIAALLHLVTRITPSQAFALNWQIINTSLSHLKFRDRDVALASFNSQAHVQLLRAPELVTYR